MQAKEMLIDALAHLRRGETRQFMKICKTVIEQQPDSLEASVARGLMDGKLAARTEPELLHVLGEAHEEGEDPPDHSTEAASSEVSLGVTLATIGGGLLGLVFSQDLTALMLGVRGSAVFGNGFRYGGLSQASSHSSLNAFAMLIFACVLVAGVVTAIVRVKKSKSKT